MSQQARPLQPVRKGDGTLLREPPLRGAAHKRVPSPFRTGAYRKKAWPFDTRRVINERKGPAVGSLRFKRTKPMQGKPEVIDVLNRALTVELTAINQYFCQARMCKNWGFERLADK